jgi:hypothetical protein
MNYDEQPETYFIQFEDFLKDFYSHKSGVWIPTDQGWKRMGERDAATKVGQLLFDHPVIQQIQDGRHRSNRLKLEVKNGLLWIAETNDVDLVVALAGYKAGLIVLNGRKILVPHECELIEPGKGDAYIIQEILDNLLGKEQCVYLYAWLKIAYRQLKNHVIRPGQVLILAGPKGCGKNLVQEQIITPILGGRFARPFKYAIDRTQFNADHFEAPHLMMSDEKGNFSRTDIQEYIRSVASDKTEYYHAKGQTADAFPVFRRLSVSCNDDQFSLKLVPPLHELTNKVLLLHCALHPLPRSNVTDEEFLALNEVIQGQLPAFLYFLEDKFQIPDRIADERFGIKGYVNPDLKEMVSGLDPEDSALDLLKAVYEDGFEKKPASMLHADIYDHSGGHLRQELMRIAKTPKQLGVLLSLLSDRSEPEITKGGIVKGYQKWNAEWNQDAE